MGTGKSGCPESNVCSAFSPPLDVPTTTISNAISKFRVSSFEFRVFAQVQFALRVLNSKLETTLLRYLAIKFVLPIQTLIRLRFRSKLQRLFVTQTKHAKHTQTVVQQIVNPRLQLFVEVDHDVAAHDHLKLVER